MSRFRTYADFESSVGRKIGDNNFDNTLGTWINNAFNEKYREAITAAQWPDVVFWEQRNPDGNGLIAYQAGTDPVTGLAVPSLEYIWGIYSNTPYNNLTLQNAQYLLNDQGATILSPTTEILANGYNAQISPVGPFWIQAVNAIPLFTGSNYVAGPYSYGATVYDPTSGNYWQNILTNAGQPLSNATYWTSTSIGSYNSGTTYSAGTIVLDLAGTSGGGYWQSNVGSNVGNSLTNPSFWTQVIVSPHADSFNYSLNTVIWKRTSPTFYQSITNSNAGNALSNATYWKTITISPYSSSTTYQPGQIVSIPGAGTFYQCIQGNVNQLISNQNFWQQIGILPYNQTTIYSTFSNTNFPLPNVVFDSSTAAFYICVLATTTQPLTSTNYWKELQIPSVIFNFMVHAVYAEYLLTSKQNDKHKTEMAYAIELLNTEKQKLQQGQNQRPVMQVFTHLNTHYFN